MSDQQLRVADLLARASKEQGERPARPRRRRRSLEEGGISVAELTGSIPRVEHTPEQPKHSAQPIDRDTQAPADEKPRSSKPQSLDDYDTVVLQVVQEGDPVHLTTNSFPAVKPGQTTTARLTPQRQEQRSDQQDSAAGRFDGLDKDDASSIVITPGETSTRAESVAVKDRDERGQRESWRDAMGTVDEHDQADELNAADEVDVEDRAVEKTYSEIDLDDSAEVDVDSDADLDEPAPERRMSAVAIIIMVVIGVVLGFAIFKGFQLLWANFSTPVTTILAIAVTAAMVGVVHALRTHRDVLTMVLAGVVGLVLTFGPSLIVGI